MELLGIKRSNGACMEFSGLMEPLGIKRSRDVRGLYGCHYGVLWAVFRWHGQ